MATSIVESTFLDKLKWLRCLSCMGRFSRNGIKFYVTSCWKVVCANCAGKMRSTTEPNKINCVFCRKVNSVCQIREEMPVNIRNLFESPGKFGLEMVNIANRGRQLRELIEQSKRSRIVKLTEDARSRIQSLRNEIRKYQNVPYRERLLQVMSEQQLQRLLTLSVEQLQQMDAYRMLESPSSYQKYSPTSSTPQSLRSHRR